MGQSESKVLQAQQVEQVLQKVRAFKRHKTVVGKKFVNEHALGCYSLLQYFSDRDQVRLQLICKKMYHMNVLMRIVGKATKAISEASREEKDNDL